MDLTDETMSQYGEFVEILSRVLRLEETNLQRFTTVQDAVHSDLRDETNSIRNILGVGYGEKMISGQPQDRLSIGIHVIHKAPQDAVHPDFLAENLVRRHLGPDYLSDVIEVGRPRLLHHDTRDYSLRIPGGVAIGDAGNTGTLGGWLVDENDDFYLLSCWHCIDGYPGGTIGKDVCHPPNGSRIAQTAISIGPTSGSTSTRVDVCLAKIDDPNRVGDFILRIGEIRSPQKVRKTFLEVCKSGAITHRSIGTIVQIGANFQLPVPSLGKDICYKNQLLIQPVRPIPFASDGDSGSLVLINEPPLDNHVVGLLVGGEDAPPIYVATPIMEVMDALGRNYGPSVTFIEYY